MSNIAERFWSKVNKGDGCWEWTAALNSSGYGSFGIGGKICGAHRVAWELTNGPITSKQFVCHRCDNPSCVNPDHLFLGDHGVNARDREAKGRGRGAAPLGERNGSAKLTEGQVRSIRLLYRNGERSQADLGRMFGVTQTVIGDLVRRKTWKHVP